MDGQTGNVVPPSSSEALRSALAPCGDTELRKRLGDAGAQARKRCSEWNRWSSKTIAVYEELA